MKPVFLSVILDRVLICKDGTMRLTYSAQETTPEKMALVFQHCNKHSFLGMKAENFTKEEETKIGDLEAEPSDKIISRSQRQRNILFRIWEHNKEGFSDFKDYYAFRMDKNLDKLRKELDELTIGV